MTILSKSLITRGVVSILGAAALSAGLAQSAIAQTVTDAPQYSVRKTSNVMVKMGVSAFNSGEYTRAADYSQKALKSGLSPARRAIAYNNLCAALGAQGDYAGAVEACDSALSLRPKLDDAVRNRDIAQAGHSAKMSAKAGAQ